MKKKIPTKRKSRSTVRTLADEALLDSSRTLVKFSKLSPPHQRAAIAMAMLVCELAGDFK
jgi:hypothetical protein